MNSLLPPTSRTCDIAKVASSRDYSHVVRSGTQTQAELSVWLHQ